MARGQRRVTRSLIVAMSENRVIGRNGRLPWHLPADLARFRRLTIGHPLVMGRRTFEALGRVLPGRTSIVVTRQADYAAADVLVAGSLPDALQKAGEATEVFVIGGEQIYRCALPWADRIYLTLVHAQLQGDAFFPELRDDEWQLTEEQRFSADARNPYDFSFRVLDRRRSGRGAEG